MWAGEAAATYRFSVSTDGFDRKFIDRSCKMLRRQVDQASPIINTFTGSRVAAVGEWIDGQPHKQREALRCFQDMSTQMAVALAANAIDNTEALADALDEPDGRIRVWAYLTLARAVVEAAVQFAHLTDTNTTPMQRILRAAAMVHDGLDEQRKLVNEFNDQDARERAAQDRDLWDWRTAKAHIDFLVSDKGKRTGVERDGETANIGINVTDQSVRRMARNIAPYRIGSAVTHSAWWFLATSLPREEDRMIPTPDPNILINAVSLTLESFEVIATACASPAQQDAVDGLRLATDKRMHILLKYADAPHGVSAPEGGFPLRA